MSCELLLCGDTPRRSNAVRSSSPRSTPPMWRTPSAVVHAMLPRDASASSRDAAANLLDGGAALLDARTRRGACRSPLTVVAKAQHSNRVSTIFAARRWPADSEQLRDCSAPALRLRGVSYGRRKWRCALPV